MFLNILTDYLFSFKKMVFWGGKKKEILVKTSGRYPTTNQRPTQNWFRLCP